MSINLAKGQTIDLKKKENGTCENDLSTLTIGLGWDINEGRGTFDLDAAAILLDKDGKLNSDKDIVWYGEKRHSSGKIWSNGDNLTGAGDGDDEQITVKLNEIDAKYEKIVFFATIYNGQSKGQKFGDVKNAFIRAVDAKNTEIAKYTMSGDSSLSDKCSFIFAEAYRKDGGWKFRALGESDKTDSIGKVAESFKTSGKKFFGMFS